MKPIESNGVKFWVMGEGVDLVWPVIEEGKPENLVTLSNPEYYNKVFGVLLHQLTEEQARGLCSEWQDIGHIETVLSTIDQALKDNGYPGLRIGPEPVLNQQGSANDDLGHAHDAEAYDAKISQDQIIIEL